MDKEIISIIVPAYNTAPWLPRCLDSLLAQSHRDLEIIVVNDGSTDNTKEVLGVYTARDNRIRAIHKENGGVTSARLRGAAEATGQWISFIDGDDEIDPGMYAHLLENAHTHGADISHCGHQVLFPDGRVNYVHNSGQLWVRDRVSALRDLMDGGQIESSLCTKLFRRELLEGLAEKMDPAIKNNEDYLMNYHLFSRAETSVYEDFCPYHYILRTGSASYRQLNRNNLFDPILVRQKILEEVPQELRDDARSTLLRWCLFGYGQLALRPDKQYDGWRREMRELIVQQREHFHLLSKRNWILANMICIAPWSFRLAYSLYVKLFQREEQH